MPASVLRSVHGKNKKDLPSPSKNHRDRTYVPITYIDTLRRFFYNVIKKRFYEWNGVEPVLLNLD